jgi:hypothetical protein
VISRLIFRIFWNLSPIPHHNCLFLSPAPPVPGSRVPWGTRVSGADAAAGRVGPGTRGSGGRCPPVGEGYGEGAKPTPRRLIPSGRRGPLP